MKTKIFIVFLSLFSGFFITFFILNFTNQKYELDFNYIADFNDDKKVVGVADNVFVAKVIKNNGSFLDDSGSKFLKTKFEVEVLENIKGNLNGKIIVIQEGGTDKFGNTYYSPFSTELENGKIYLLSTIGNNYTINSHPNASSKLIKKFSYKDGSDVYDLSRWTEAYKNEILEENGRKISSGKNSFSSLSEEQKQNLEKKRNLILGD